MKWMRLSARLIVVLWAGFWIFFAVGSAIGGGGKTDIPASESLKGILAVTAIVLVCAGAIYLAWRRPLVAGISLILIAIAAMGAFLSISRPESVMLIIGLPPLLSGILFLVSSARRQKV
jgi:NADH:ubiquinone oxidoreductase subunit 2 (subunit N)